jgi:aryl-alcohol dehydrogenase-like predicted oxidoreductase
MPPPTLTLGTSAIHMLIVPPDSDEYSQNFAAIKKSGIRHLETAALYPFHAQGEAEKWIGDGEYAENSFAIDTKIFYGDLALGGKGHLEIDAVEESLDRSLEKLRFEKVSCDFDP